MSFIDESCETKIIYFAGNLVTSSKTELRKSQSGKRTKRKPRVLFSQVRYFFLHVVKDKLRIINRHIFRKFNVYKIILYC